MENSKQRLLEVMGRLDKSFKPKLNENFNEDNEEFIAHGTYTVSNSGGYEVMLNDSGDAARVRDAYGSDNPKTSDWLEIEFIPDEESGESEPVIDPNGYNIPLNMVMRLREEDNLSERRNAVDPWEEIENGPRSDVSKNLSNNAYQDRYTATRGKSDNDDSDVPEYYNSYDSEEPMRNTNNLTQTQIDRNNDKSRDSINRSARSGDDMYESVVQRWVRRINEGYYDDFQIKIKNGDVWLEYYKPSESKEYTDGENWYNRSGEQLRDPMEYDDSDPEWTPMGDE